MFLPRDVTQGLLRKGVAAALYKLEAIKKFARPGSSRILRYERIVDRRSLPFPPVPRSWVSPEHFEAQLRYLSENFRLLHLEEVFYPLEPLPSNTAVITIDGGWLETYNHAFPLLKKYNVPATLFLPTSFIGSKDMFWQDKFLAACTLLERSGLQLPENAIFTADILQRLDKAYGRRGAMTKSKALFMLRFLERLPANDRVAALAEVFAAKELSHLNFKRESFLSWEQVREMASAGVRVGSLTHLNFPITEMSEADLVRDLRDSFKAFEENGVIPLPILAFPQGKVPFQHLQLLAEFGFLHGLAGPETESLEAMELPVQIHERIAVSDEGLHGIDLFACAVNRVRFLKIDF